MDLPHVSKLVPVPTTMPTETLLSPGSVALLEGLRPGDLATSPVKEDLLLLGLAIATMDKKTIIKPTVTTVRTTAVLRQLPHGSNRLLELEPEAKLQPEFRAHMLDTLATEVMELLPEWVLLLVSLPVVLVLLLLLGWAISTPSSSSMLEQPPLPRRLLEMRLLPLPAINPRLLLPLELRRTLAFLDELPTPKFQKFAGFDCTLI